MDECVLTAPGCSESVSMLALHNSGIPNFITDDSRMTPENPIWAAFRCGIQLDSTFLEEQYLGSAKTTAIETVKTWERTINARLQQCKLESVASFGNYKAELEVAIGAIQRAAFVIRSLQRILLGPAVGHPLQQILRSIHDSVSCSKTDKTPVTVADFAVQALIIDALGSAFPEDSFIAEEDSVLVRKDPVICKAILFILEAATGAAWSAEKLCRVLDSGGFGAEPIGALSRANAQKQRVWVLDPIDGTKGFMRGEHCCTGLGLLVDGVTQLSVLGCPSLNLLRLLQGSSYDDKDITYIDPPISLHANQPDLPVHTKAPTVFHPHSGSVYFAVTNQGAFARSLSMPLGAAFEVTTSAVAESAKARLCESAEALFGDREVTARAAERLGVRNEYLRIDGMCKHCVVGVGAADATLRLPPAGYREKIWDHVAGDHFVREAGGTVTDLRGARLDYSAVQRAMCGIDETGATAGGCRELGAEVQGVVISNGLLHAQLLDTVNDVRSCLKRG